MIPGVDLLKADFIRLILGEIAAALAIVMSILLGAIGKMMARWRVIELIS